MAPQTVFASPGHEGKPKALDRPVPEPIVFGAPYEALLDRAAPEDRRGEVDPEDPLLILYTSGTTGLPKGAAICHRAEMAHNLVIRAEFGVAAGSWASAASASAPWRALPR